jgi:hypothetical protein
MPSSEKIISPGVFTNEIDQTFLPAAIGEIGAALIGPTVKGPAGIPTVVTSYSEYQALFGDTFKSGSNYYQYLTSHTAREYLKHAGRMTVVRILADGGGSVAPATADVPTTGSFQGDAIATGSWTFVHVPSGSTHAAADEITIGSVDYTFVSSSTGLANSATQVFVPFITADTATTTTTVAVNLVNAINDNERDSVTSLNISASSPSAAVVHITGSITGSGANYTVTTGSGGDATATTVAFIKPTSDTAFNIQGGTNASSTGTAFTLTTLSDGALLNNAMTTAGTNNVLTDSGSKDNIRWEISTNNPKKGTFTLLIRRGDDSIKRKTTLETWNNVSLDPNSSNYVSKVIGDQYFSLEDAGTTDPYLQPNGDYPNKSKYVRVSAVNNTVDYLDENGSVRVPADSASIPALGSGSSNGGFTGGSVGHAGFDGLGNFVGDSGASPQALFYNNMVAQNIQGFDPGSANSGADGKNAYEDAINLLGNQDEYDINLVLLPGLTDAEANAGSAIITKAIDMCEDRGDCFVIADTGLYGQAITGATGKAEGRDSNYAGMYYPWVQIADTDLGLSRWVPPSVVLSGVYAFNDKVAHPWFAPAGLNRGGIDSAIQAERKLTHSNRDTLYDSNVNPIATFPAQGVCAWGQKTLQKKASALDRINVRRLLIKVKKFIASSSRFLVFEQNNASTRRRFLNIVNPFLEQVQSNSGLNAFRVVMDESNNTPDVVDRNVLYGQIFVQPTRTAEFIVLDFTVQPTGATFPE